MEKFKAKCFTGDFDNCVCLDGDEKCWGGFSNKPCRFLAACIKQHKGEIPEKDFKNFLKKSRRMNSFKS